MSNQKRPTRPASPAKAAAARANGAKSKGPLSAAGKSRSSQNAIRHGCYSNALLLCNENPKDWEDLLTSFIHQFNPAGKVELGLVEEMAAAHWRIRRYWFAESATIDMVMLHQQPDLDQEFAAITEPGRLASAISHLISPTEPQALQFYQRLESRLRRHFSRALSDLIRIQQLRLNSQPAQLPQAKNDETNPPPVQPPTPQPLAAKPEASLAFFAPLRGIVFPPTVQASPLPETRGQHG